MQTYRGDVLFENRAQLWAPYFEQAQSLFTRKDTFALVDSMFKSLSVPVFLAVTGWWSLSGTFRVKHGYEAAGTKMNFVILATLIVYFYRSVW